MNDDYPRGRQSHEGCGRKKRDTLYTRARFDRPRAIDSLDRPLRGCEREMDVIDVAEEADFREVPARLTPMGAS